MGGLAWRHNACSRINFRPLPQRNSSKSDFKDSHISRFCFIFQVIQVILLRKFCSGGEVDLSFISWTIFHERDCKGFFLAKRSWKKIFIKCSNSGINESTPQTQSNFSWISSKAALQISFMKSRWWKKLHENGPKIGPATVVKKPSTQSNLYIISKTNTLFHVETDKVFTSHRGGFCILPHKPLYEEVHSSRSSCTAPKQVRKRFVFGWK